MTRNLSRTVFTLLSLSLLLTAACGGGGAATDQPAAALVALCNGETPGFGGENPLNQIAYFAQAAPDADFAPLDTASVVVDENRVATNAGAAQYALCIAITGTEELETCDNAGTDVVRYAVTHTATLYNVADGAVLGEVEAEAAYGACPQTYPEGVTALYPRPNMAEINPQVDALIAGAS